MTDRETETAATGPLGRKFWLELTLAGIAAVLFVLTLAWHDWIEAFGIEPDGGNGSLEWVVVGAFALAALVCGALARAEWRRSRPAPTKGG